MTGVLAKCGGLPEEEAARLTVGQREALLLQLRSLTFGDRMSCVLRCPRAECGERMDLDLRASELILDSPQKAAGIHEVAVDDWLVKFRVPDGADQEAVAAILRCEYTGAQTNAAVAAVTAAAKHEAWMRVMFGSSA